TPTPRLALVWGKMASAGIRGISQIIVIFIVALLLGIKLNFTIIAFFGAVLIVILGAGFFTGLSMIIASVVKTRERFMGIGQLITLPLFFASNAIYPITIMPSWLQFVATINPLTYMVEGLRAILVTNSYASLPLDIAFLAIASFL